MSHKGAFVNVYNLGNSQGAISEYNDAERVYIV